MNFSTLRLRPYQLEAQQAIVEARTRGFRAQLVSLATGLGKSVVIATLPDLLELRPGDVTLVVAHRDELIEQLVEKMTAQNPDAKVGVEKAERKRGGRFDDRRRDGANPDRTPPEAVRSEVRTPASRCS